MAEQPSSSVSKLAKRCLEGLDTFDVAAVTALFAKGAVWSEPYGALVAGERRGRGAIARLVIDLAQLTAGTHRRRVHEIVTSDESAAAICTVTACIRGSETTWGEVLVFRSDGSVITEVSVSRADTEAMAALSSHIEQLEFQATG